MNHLLHHSLPPGSLLEISPSQVELGRLDDEQGGYAMSITDGEITIRVVLPPDDYVNLIRSAAAKLDEEGAPSGKLHVAKTMPAELTRSGPNGRV